MICFWSLFLQSDHTGHDEKIGNRGPSLRRGTPPLLQQEHLETFPSKTYGIEVKWKWNIISGMNENQNGKTSSDQMCGPLAGLAAKPVMEGVNKW